jgi:hypothetical protein
MLSAKRGSTQSQCRTRNTDRTKLDQNRCFSLVPGGGVEPPRGCPRRILSPFFTLLQGLARSRRNSQIASIHKGFSRYGVLHRIAPNRTKFRYKPAPKSAPELCPFFAIAPIGLPLQRRRFQNRSSCPRSADFSTFGHAKPAPGFRKTPVNSTRN